MSSSTHLDNKGKDILILGKGPTQGLGEHSLSAEKMYSINSTKVNTKFRLSLHYNGDDSYLFINSKEIHKFKAKDCMIAPNNLCLGNVSKDFSASNMKKKIGINGYIYDFSVDYDSIAVDDIKYIHKYLMKKNEIVKKMFKFVKQIFISAIMLFSNLSSVNSLECVSISNQECKVRPEIGNINSKEPIFYPYSIRTSKCSGSCNNINDPYAKLCVPNTIKNLNAKVFNLISRTNKTRHIKRHETCKCKYRLDPSFCNNKKRWNEDKCRWECKELFDKGLCDKGFIWNLSNCECKYKKSCDIGEYFDYENCKCTKKLVDELVEECTENIEETELTEHENKDENKYGSCTLFMVLFSISLAINVGIGIYFIYFR